MLIRQFKSTTNRTTSANLTLLAALLGGSVMLSGCGNNEHHEAHEVTEVAEEASQLAKENAPEPEVLDVESTVETVATAETETTDMDATDTPVDTQTTETEADAAAVEEVDESAEAVPAAGDEAVLAADAGKKTYDKVCVACHETGLLNAPKRGDSDAWAPRIAKGKETLYDHSANGFNQMPAQAVNDVSKEEVAAAVDYLVAEAQ